MKRDGKAKSGNRRTAKKKWDGALGLALVYMGEVLEKFLSNLRVF